MKNIEERLVDRVNDKGDIDRYEFKKEGEKAALLELGPRMTLRLKWLQKGTFDTRLGEFEWVLKVGSSILLPNWGPVPKS